MSSISKLFRGLFAAVTVAALAGSAQAAYLRVHAAPFSMTALDSGTPDANLSGKNFSKVLVNYEEGEISAKGVTAVVLQLPEALLVYAICIPLFHILA